MDTHRQHDMELYVTHPSGAEEWVCTACTRRIVLQWPPKYRKIVLDRGDANVVHSGGEGGVRMSSTQMSDKTNEDVSDIGLGPWLEGLADIDLGE